MASTNLSIPAPRKSPNFYPNRVRHNENGRVDTGKPEIVVLHLTEGYFDGAVSWLCNKASKASANIVARKADGYLLQIVDDKDGPQTNGRIRQSKEPKILEYQKRGINPNLFSLTIEVEWFQAWGLIPVGGLLYNSLVKKVAEWCVKYKIPVDRDHILGHFEIDVPGKPACGRHIPWDEFMVDVKQLVDHAHAIDVTPKPQPLPEPALYRVFYGGQQQGAYADKDNAYAFGWQSYNRGKKDIYLTEPNKALYTFDKHLEDNPDHPEQLRFQLQTDLVADKDVLLKIVEELKTKYGLASSLVTVEGDRA